VPAPVANAYRTIDRSIYSRAKSKLVRNYEILRAASTGEINYTDYHHTGRGNTNRGDVAIGQAVEQQIRSTFGQNAKIDVVGWGDVTERNVDDYSKAYDLVVIGGGGYIFLDPNGQLNARARDIDLLECFRSRICAYGIGLNRLMNESQYYDFRALPAYTKNWLRRFSSLAFLITVRDNSTAELFSEGIGREVPVTGDPALAIANLSSYSDIANKGVMQNHVGINVAAHGRRALACSKQVLPVLEKVYRSLVRKAGTELHYFVHDDAEYSIIRHLRLRRHKFIVIDTSPSEMVDKYAETTLVINQMLHSSILAFRAGTPAINLAYDLKTVAFYQLFGLEKYCLPWSEVTEKRLNATINVLREEITEVKYTIAAKRNILLARQNEALQKMLTACSP
jgi:polysaccharide pyruvyl transferase WcaK-like protein